MVDRKLTGRRRHRAHVVKYFGIVKRAILVLQVEEHLTGHTIEAHGGIESVDELAWRDARVEDLALDEIGRVG